MPKKCIKRNGWFIFEFLANTENNERKDSNSLLFVKCPLFLIKG